MKTRPDFDDAASAGIITSDQARALAAFYAAQPGRGAAFDLTHVLWYAGALVVIGAMGLFSTLAFGLMGGPALTATALIYAAAFVAAGRHLRIAHDLPVPGGLLIACAVAMTPLAVYGLQESWGWGEQGRPGAYRDVFAWIKDGWVPMEAATLLTSAIALRATRFGFITVIAAVALWFLSMDIGLWATGPDLDWETRRTISLWFGLSLIALRLGGGPVPEANGLRVLAPCCRHPHLLGRGDVANFSDSEVAKALYALMNVAHHRPRHFPLAANLRGVRRHRRGALSRRSGEPGVQGLAALPLRVVAHRSRPDRPRYPLPAPCRQDRRGDDTDAAGISPALAARPRRQGMTSCA